MERRRKWNEGRIGRFEGRERERKNGLMREEEIKFNLLTERMILHYPYLLFREKVKKTKQ